MGGAIYEWKGVVEGVSVALVGEGGPALVQRRNVEANLRTSETVHKLSSIFQVVIYSPANKLIRHNVFIVSFPKINSPTKPSTLCFNR